MHTMKEMIERFEQIKEKLTDLSKKIEEVNQIRNKKMSIEDRYGLPKEYLTCPSCGFLYGHNNSKVCLNCEECSFCCNCDNKNIKSINEAIPILLKKDDK